MPLTDPTHLHPHPPQPLPASACLSRGTIIPLSSRLQKRSVFPVRGNLRQTRPSEFRPRKPVLQKKTTNEKRHGVPLAYNRLCAKRNGMCIFSLSAICAPHHAMTLISRRDFLPPPSPPVMGTSTEVAGYFVHFVVFFRRARVYLTSSPPSAPLLRASLACDSITFGYIGPGTGPIAGRQTVSTAWRTNTRRRGRASVVGYAVRSTPLHSIFFFRFVVVPIFFRSDFPTNLREGVTPLIYICPTPQTICEDRRVLNLIQEPCDNCKEANYDRGRRR